MADFYSGSTPGLLVCETNAPFFNPGQFGSDRLFSTNILAGATGYCQVQIRDSAYPTADASRLNNSYFGYSQLFSLTGSGSIVFSSLVRSNSPAFSTWAYGSYDMSAEFGFPAFGAIMVEAVPEPALLSLIPVAALTLAACRRKRSAGQNSRS